MHYLCEIIIPPDADVEAAVKKCLAPFDENADTDTPGFWDWWVIGGRWGGNKITARLDPQRLKEFQAELNRRGATVSSLQWGKPTLSPAEQVAWVDELWREWFPGAGDRCLLVDAYDPPLESNILPWAELPDHYACRHLIVGGGHNGEAQFMLVKTIWNGVTYQDTDWDGTIGGFKAICANRDRPLPPANWLAVTVDYHS